MLHMQPSLEQQSFRLKSRRLEQPNARTFMADSTRRAESSDDELVKYASNACLNPLAIGHEGESKNYGCLTRNLRQRNRSSPTLLSLRVHRYDHGTDMSVCSHFGFAELLALCIAAR